MKMAVLMFQEGLVNIDSVSVVVIQVVVAILVTRVVQVTHPHSNRAAVADPVVHTRVVIFPNGIDSPQSFYDHQVFHSNYYSCLFVLPVMYQNKVNRFH